MERQLLVNGAFCTRCEDEIYSVSVHDFKMCKCGAIGVDGGLEYERRIGHSKDYISLSMYLGDDFTKIRERFSRWNRNTQEYVSLNHMSNEWLQNVINYFIEKELLKIPRFIPIFALYIEEKLYRAENEIFISEQLELKYA